MTKEYKDYASEMKEKLNSVSKSFCLAKWQQVSLHLPQGLTQSCYHPPAHSIPIESIKIKPSNLHNSEIKINERKQMLIGQRPEGCSYCWKIEDTSEELSDRHYRSSEWWASPTFEEVINNSYDYDVIPRYVEVNFNQACNFKCMYCSPHLSTSWEEDVKNYGGYLLDGMIHNDLDSLEEKGLMPLKIPNKENPYVEAFWQWWPEIYRKLRVFRMTGGEPLMDKNTFRILDYVNDNPHGHLELSITSNLCPPDQKLFENFIGKIKDLEKIRTYKDKENLNPFTGNHWYVDKGFKHFWLYISLDSTGKQAEYIRNGLDYQRLLDNTRKFLRETRYSTISFINTFNILSIPNLKSFLELILNLRKEFGWNNQEEFEISPVTTDDEKMHGITHKKYKQQKFQRIFFDIPLLRYPDWFSVQLATPELIDEVRQCLIFMEEHRQDENYGHTFEGFKPHEISKLKRNLAVMEQSLNINDLLINRKRFCQFVEQYDARRSTDFLEVFPTMKDFWKTCKDSNGTRLQ
jgi:organic radical activating enzyme